MKDYTQYAEKIIDELTKGITSQILCATITATVIGTLSMLELLTEDNNNGSKVHSC